MRQTAIFRDRDSTDDIMRRTKLIEKNLELGFEFMRYLLTHPEMEKMIPKNAQVVLLPDYDERLKRFNLRNSKRKREKGQPVVYVRVKRMAASRLEGLSLQVA